MPIAQHMYMRRNSLENMRQLAAAKGGLCLSKKYINMHAHLLWQCRCGFKWVAKPNNIQQGSWCPLCAIKRIAKSKRTINVDMLKRLASSRGGKCLSTEYVNPHAKLQWQCDVDHIWEASYASIQQGHWCHECRGSYGEQLCRFVFETFTGLNFPRSRTAIAPFELDGFNVDKRIAFEFHGRQHFEYIPNWHRDVGDFESQQKRDQLKINECQHKNIHLFVTNYTVLDKPNKIIDDIKSFLLSIGLFIDTKIDIKDFSFGKSKIKYLQNLALQRGGFCLAKSYRAMNQKVLWKCQYGHKWMAQPASIVHEKTWCPECAGLRKKTIKQMQDLAFKHGGRCLSKDYINDKTKLKWECSAGHKWESTPNCVGQGKWCASCGQKRRWEAKRNSKNVTQD